MENQLPSTQATDSPKDWWAAVKIAASLIVNDGCGFEDEGLLKKELLAKGFEEADIAKAIAWVEKAAVSGQMMDVFGMLCPQPEGSRVDSPLERVFMSDAVWKDLASSRSKGLLSGDTTEMIIEGIRAVDTRDWDDDEVRTFIKDVLTANGQEADGDRIELNRRRRLSDFYS